MNNMSKEYKTNRRRKKKTLSVHCFSTALYDCVSEKTVAKRKTNPKLLSLEAYSQLIVLLKKWNPVFRNR